MCWVARLVLQVKEKATPESRAWPIAIIFLCRRGYGRDRERRGSTYCFADQLQTLMPQACSTALQFEGGVSLSELDKREFLSETVSTSSRESRRNQEKT